MKKIMTVMAAMLLLAGSLKAQIFIIDDEETSLRDVSSAEEVSLIIPIVGITADQYGEYAPAGSGALLLAAMGGAYLLGKKKKK